MRPFPLSVLLLTLTPSPPPPPRYMHTSGTTSRPKRVLLTHQNLAGSLHNIQRTYELSSDDRTLLVMPLFHVHGLIAGLLTTLASGGAVIVHGRFAASKFWKHVVDHEVITSPLTHSTQYRTHTGG